MIIPVPLHPRREKKRGYNQAEKFASGLSEAMNIPVSTSCLYRQKANVTQSGKSRFSRWENVEGIFGVRTQSLLEHKHILLVDDVITTGSTLEACAHALRRIEGVRISIATIASAD